MKHQAYISYHQPHIYRNIVVARMAALSENEGIRHHRNSYPTYVSSTRNTIVMMQVFIYMHCC